MGDRSLTPKLDWVRLEGDAIAGAGHLRQKVAVDAPVDIYLAIERPSGSRVLALGFEQPPRNSLAETVKLRGLRVSEAPFAMGHKPWTVSIATSRTDDNQMFGELADDLVSVIAATSSGDEASDALAARLECWHRFLDHAGSAGLSAEAQVGLYGELWCMRDLLVPAIAIGDAVMSWQGPDGGPQDFQGSGWSVEVKTTRQLAPTVVRVSNERQLDAGDGFLALIIVGIEERPQGGETLPGIVESLRALVRGTLVFSTFEDRLLSAGYMDAQASRYGDTGYAIRRVLEYAIAGDFPRIVETGLPCGIGNVAYDLSLDACEGFRMQPDQLPAMIAAARR